MISIKEEEKFQQKSMLEKKSMKKEKMKRIMGKILINHTPIHIMFNVLMLILPI